MNRPHIKRAARGRGLLPLRLLLLHTNSLAAMLSVGDDGAVESRKDNKEVLL